MMALSRDPAPPSSLFLAALALLVATPARADDHGGRWFQVVSPGRSIQQAIDRASSGGWVLVLPGVYHETADATNGLNITKGIHLVGLSILSGSHLELVPAVVKGLEWRRLGDCSTRQ